MFGSDLSTTITTISSDQIDALFSGSDTLPGADQLKFGKDSNLIGDVPDIKPEEVEDIVDPKEEVKAEEEKKDELPEEKKDDKPEEKKDDKVDEEEVKVPNELYSTSVNYLIEKGIFKDFEGREELKLDDQTFAELLEAQVNAIVEEKYNAQKQATGEYGQAIIEYIEKGGDPDAIIDVFKEQKAIQQFEIKDEDSQEALISQYYKEVHEWTPGQIKRHLNTLKAEENALEEEANTIKGKYDQHYQKQLQTLQAEQEAARQAQLEAQKQYEQSLKATIKEYGTDDVSRKKLENALFKQKTVEINGQAAKVNDFYLKFAELQKDPKSYIELVEYVTYKENYLKRQANKTKEEVTKKTWNFIKSGAAISKNNGSSHQESQAEKKQQGTDFSFVKRLK